MASFEDKTVDAPPSVSVKRKSNFISSVGNFSIQYNLSCASVAIQIMDSTDFPQPMWASYTILGLVFAGAVMGMCVMGYFGDVIGRRKAFILTLSFTVLGGFGCAFFPWTTNPNNIYLVIAIFRFMLGVGVGGIYPLSATTASENTTAEDHVADRVGWAFFWQTPGGMAPYAVAILVLLIPGSLATQIQFRTIMGLGAIPAAIILAAAFNHQDSSEFRKVQTASPFREASKYREYWRLLIGTAGTWFLYDIAYYGTVIFTPPIISNIFPGEDNIALCWQSLVAQAIGIPGCIFAIWALKPRGVYWLMLWGFVLMAVLFTAFAITYELSPDGQPILKFVLFCGLQFALNYGPNVATYVLPAVAFPLQIRSTFHGLSSAGAKIGAVIGTFIFQPIEDVWGIAGVAWMQVVLSLVGIVVTMYFVEPDDVREKRMRGENAPLLAKHSHTQFTH